MTAKFLTGTLDVNKHTKNVLFNRKLISPKMALTYSAKFRQDMKPLTVPRSLEYLYFSNEN